MTLGVDIRSKIPKNKKILVRMLTDKNEYLKLVKLL